MKRDGNAPALFRRAFRPLILELIAKERKQIASRANASRERLREIEDVLAWLDGENVSRDVKIEARQREGVWRLVLLVGVLGYSAANPMLTVENI